MLQSNKSKTQSVHIARGRTYIITHYRTQGDRRQGRNKVWNNHRGIGRTCSLHVALIVLFLLSLLVCVCVRDILPVPPQLPPLIARHPFNLTSHTNHPANSDTHRHRDTHIDRCQKGDDVNETQPHSCVCVRESCTSVRLRPAPLADAEQVERSSVLGVCQEKGPHQQIRSTCRET